MKSLVEVVLEHSMEFPDKTAIVFDDACITYKELADKIYSFAHTLKSKKISKGSRIVIEADNLTGYFCSFLGCQLYSCIAVPIEKNVSIYRLQEILKATKPKLVFFKDSGENYEEYFQCNIQDELKKTFSYPKMDTECAIISSTGTTGNAVLISHTNRSMLATAQNLSQGTNITKDTVLFCNIPFHLASGYRRVMAALYQGATAVVTNETITLDKLAESIRKQHINHLATTHSLLRIITEEEISNEFLQGVKYVESASGPLFSHTVMHFHKRFPETVLYNVYGTTESGCILINDTSINYTEGCIGKPTCNASICLVDENRQEIKEPGKYGYVAVTGDMNMSGYYHKKSLTEKVMLNNRIILKDIVYFDEDGYYYFVSRVGDIINVNGHKVIPSDIENIASQYAGVEDCGCIAKGDAQLGQVPILYVECKDKNNFDFEGLKSYLTKHLEPYKVPKEILPIERIPRTSTGKLMRKSLQVL